MKLRRIPVNLSRAHRRRAIGIATAAVACLAIIPVVSNASANEITKGAPVSHEHGDTLTNYDSRRDANPRGPLAARRAALAAQPQAGVVRLRQSLGSQAIVEIDPVTATARTVTRLDGFLTKPSKSSPTTVALNFIRANTDVFGLDATEVRALKLRKVYTDIEGTRHLSFVQTVGGVPVFGNGVKAHVAKDGRLIQVDGAPVATLPASISAPKLSASQARAAAVTDTFGDSTASVRAERSDAARTTEFTGGDRAQLVVFKTPDSLRLAWQTITMKEGYLHVVDAQTGRVLLRQSIVAKDTGTAWENAPGAPRGGVAHTYSFSNKGWLPGNSQTLNGNVAHVYLDLNDNNAVDQGEEVGPSAPRSFKYPFTPFMQAGCSKAFPCAWDPTVANSWQTNAKQNATQMFYFLGAYHDHLKVPPIGFNRAAGNFDARDGDAVEGNALDGANSTGKGLPDSFHVDNANMSTPPDGIAPRMQMYLFGDPAAPADDPFIAGNSGDTADIVYHEYTHGLSNRLVVDANGVSTLGNIQAGSMGEGWSDWYALDLLAKQRHIIDTAAPGEVRVGQYIGGGQDLIRTQPIDCPVGTTSTRCPGAGSAGPGGYTYGDFGKIFAGPEVHADGEIWVETLWDLRTALGSRTSESLVTRAMELSPANPSFLDMRNSILTADLVVNKGRNQKKIWKVFAARGMGWFAGSIDGDDVAPVEDFSLPPAANTPRGTVTGTVVDADSHTPIAGAVVAFGGHNSGFAGDYAATTNGQGVYTITGVLPGTYPKVFGRSAGYDPIARTVSVGSGSTTLDWALRRDWAAAGGGAAITFSNGDDYTDYGCGPGALIDQSQGSGWSTDAAYTNGVIAPRSVVVKLPVAVNIAELQINPSNTCGDGGSSSTGDYSVETSADGTTWTVASVGHFGVSDRRMHAVALTAGSAGVQYIRYTMKGTQVGEAGGNPADCPAAGFSGCVYVDSVELAVYGTK